MEYVCAQCGGTFEKGWTDEEAAAEAAVQFPELPREELATVCEDCYTFLLEANHHWSVSQ